MFINTFITDVADSSAGLTNAGFFTGDDLIQPSFSVNSIEVKNGIIDRVRAESGTDLLSPWDGSINDSWGWGTRLDAKFEGDTAGGSIEYAVDATSEIRIKRRKAGEFKWKTLYIKPVNTIDDFQFTIEDKLNASNIDYEYAYVPVVNGEEAKISYTGVKSQFDGYFLSDPFRDLHIILNAKNEITYNQETLVQTTIGRKFPFVIKNGDVGYYSGTLSASFAPRTADCSWDVENSAKWREEIDEYLTNGVPKILKDWMGHIYIVSIIDAIPEDAGNYVYAPVYQINWVQIGNAESIADLYDNGFIDTDIDRTEG